MAEPFDVRTGSNPGTAVASIDGSGNLTLAGTVVLADQAAAPTQVPGSTVLYTQAGSLYAKSGAGTATQLGAGGGQVTWPLSGLGLLAASLDPAEAMNTSNISNGQAFFARTYIPAGVTVTKLWCAVRDAGTWDAATTGSTLGIYTDAGVFVDKIATSDSLWAANGWVGGALSGGAIASQTSGRFVYLAGLVRGMTVAPAVQFMTSAADSAGNLVWFNTGPTGTGQTNRRAFYQSGLTSLPGSFTPASAGTVTTFVLLLAVT